MQKKMELMRIFLIKLTKREWTDVMRKVFGRLEIKDGEKFRPGRLHPGKDFLTHVT